MSEGITILGKFVTKEDIEHRLISLDERNKELECNNTMLREELEKIAANCLTALAGVVCTPAEGYIKAGTSWIASDIRALVKDYHQGSHNAELTMAEICKQTMTSAITSNVDCGDYKHNCAKFNALKFDEIIKAKFGLN